MEESESTQRGLHTALKSAAWVAAVVGKAEKRPGASLPTPKPAPGKTHMALLNLFSGWDPHGREC